MTQRNYSRRTRIDEDGNPTATPLNPLVSNTTEHGITGQAWRAPDRKSRRRAKAAAARAGSPSRIAEAFYATAIDGKTHVVRKGQTKTVCGRQGITLADDASLHRNRCAACTRALA